MHLTNLQLAPLYDKLKSRLYNALYHREKRLEAKYKGDKSKMREDLGFEVPVRIKRPRKSKENSTTASPQQTTSDVVSKDDDTSVRAGECSSDANSGSPMDASTPVQKNTTQHTTGGDLRPDVRDSANTNEMAVSLTSGINSTNSVAGSNTSSARPPQISIDQSAVELFFTTPGATTQATPGNSIASKNYKCFHTCKNQHICFFCSEYFSRLKRKMQRHV